MRFRMALSLNVPRLEPDICLFWPGTRGLAIPLSESVAPLLSEPRALLPKPGPLLGQRTISIERPHIHRLQLILAALASLVRRFITTNQTRRLSGEDTLVRGCQSEKCRASVCEEDLGSITDGGHKGRQNDGEGPEERL